MNEAPTHIANRALTIEVADDTCDRCGPAVRAFVYVEMNAGPLTYCAHCGTRFWDELNRQARKIIDFRYLVEWA